MKLATILLGTTIFLASCGGTESTQKEGEKPAPKVEEKETAKAVTATQLIKDYEENEVSADNAYKGKDIEITGRVESIAKDISDDAYVTLTNGDEMAITSVQCYFKDNDELASLKKGQKVTVIGEVDGKMMNVMVKDCELKK